MNFKVTIKEASKELTAKERVSLKNTTGAFRIDELVTPEEPIVITPWFWAVLNVENEASTDKEYEQYVIVTTNGDKYLTGSQTFFRSFKSIWEDMAGEDFDLKIFKLPSKNFQGRYFLTCDIV